MNEINEIKLPKGVDRIAVKQHDDRIVFEFIPEKPKFKEGDFVYEDERIMIVKSYPNRYHAILWYTRSDNPRYNGTYAVDFSSPTFRHATEEEKQLLIDEMRKDGKRWNAEKKCIEDIPKSKFKAGDKVTLKKGCSSKNALTYLSVFDEFVGKELTINKCINGTFVGFDETNYIFYEDWLEPYTDEPKKGDFAILWDDNDRAYAIIRIYDRKDLKYHYDSSDTHWDNAIKFESKEQYEKILKGED